MQCPRDRNSGMSFSSFDSYTSSSYDPIISSTNSSSTDPLGSGTDSSSTESTSPSPPLPPSPSTPFSLSDAEAENYYAGLPSSPRLVARTSTTPWNGYMKPKQLGVVTDHKLNTVWEDNVAFRIHTCLDEMGVQWTSTDVVLIGVVGESAPVVLWIGVSPQTLASEDGNTAASKCLGILKEFEINDVHVEIRESSVIRYAGPKLLAPVFDNNPTVAVRQPLTHALGLPISPEAFPTIAGTGGFFMMEGGTRNRLLLITARHVVLPLDRYKNSKFEYKNSSQRRFNILLPGDDAYKSCLASIETQINEQQYMIQHWGLRLEKLKGRDDFDADEIRGQIEASKKAVETLSTFYQDVKNDWVDTADRVLGHIVFSPPMSLGAGTAGEGYTEDYAVIEVDTSKIDRVSFEGNVIDLGTKIPRGDFTQKMYPTIKNSTSFKYPYDRLLKLWGTMSVGDRNTKDEDRADEGCVFVIKSGSATGVTIGRANGIKSYIRKPTGFGTSGKSKEWSILSYDSTSGPFSTPGDSGAVIVDGHGRIGGLLTAGAGMTDSSDITYATPIAFILKSIKANGFPHAHPFNPTP